MNISTLLAASSIAVPQALVVAVVAISITGLISFAAYAAKQIASISQAMSATSERLVLTGERLATLNHDVERLAAIVRELELSVATQRAKNDK